MPPRLLVTRKLPSLVEDRIRLKFDAEFNKSDSPPDLQTLLARAQEKDALLVTLSDKLNAQAINLLPDSVRIIASYSVGYEHIDIEAAATRGIKVTNTPDVLTAATADIAMLLILGAARGAAAGMDAIRSGSWGKWAPTSMLGVDLANKRLGIYGLGRIGQAVAQRARAFGMNIFYHSRKRQPPEVEAALQAHWCESREALFASSDFLSLHCASTPETRKMMTRTAFALLPRGAIFVNTARGDLVDDDALIEALQSGHLASAGLDVFNNEPDIDPRYRTLPNAFLLPHLGSATVETRNAMGFRALANLEDFFAGKEPRDIVRPAPAAGQN